MFNWVTNDADKLNIGGMFLITTAEKIQLVKHVNILCNKLVQHLFFTVVQCFDNKTPSI